MNASVAVLMSSFNGEKFIEEQIASILRQKEVVLHLYVRDDGSTDGTRRILDRYAGMEAVTVSEGKNLGVGNSFMTLLRSVPEEFDFYAFSDQDDIWEEDKLISAIRQIQNKPGCVLYASNLTCVDEENREIGMRYDPNIVFDSGLLNVICNSRCYGCTQVFTKELFWAIKNSRPSEQILRIKYHDSWVTCSAATVGTIIFDRESHIRYRRHGGNVTVYDQGKVMLWQRRVYKLFHPKERNPRSLMARELTVNYPKLIDADPDRELIRALAYPTKLTNIKTLIQKRTRFMSSPFESDFVFILKVLMGLV